MLLDPFEEQFDLPALLVECSDFLSAAFEVIGDQDQVGFVAVTADPDTTHVLPEVVIGTFGIENFLVEANHFVRLNIEFRC